MRPTPWAIASVLLLAACSAAPLAVVTTATTPAQGPTGPVALRVAAKGEAGPVEVGGISPNDTVVVVRRGVRRTVILRHGPPDRTDFAELTLPPGVFASAPAESVLVTIRIRPGVYGVELSADAPWGPGAELAYKYAVHFAPPADALRRYGTLTEVDHHLTLARRERNGELTIYLSTHPAPDVVNAFIPGEGTYLLVVAK